MRTTIDIDADLLMRLRAEAYRRGVPFKEVLSGAIRRGLETRPPAKRAAYKSSTFSMGAPSPRYDFDKALSLAADLEDVEIA